MFTALAPGAGLGAPQIVRMGSFDGINGSAPYAALRAAGNGLYYGTTSSGGANGLGAIFAFDAPSGTISLKGSFEDAIGRTPYSALTAAGNGKYYGTTPSGGVYGPSAIFEFDPAGAGTITLKGSFDGTNGRNAYGALLGAADGKYYGTTVYGGVAGAGSLYEFDPSGAGSITLKGSLDGLDGYTPYAALTAAGNGKYYGTAFAGGNSSGTIFEFDPAGTGSITRRASFVYSDGSGPFASLLAADNGLFYGTTFYGGANTVGAIFEFDPSSGGITLKGSFDGVNGSGPYAALTAAGNGKYYGTTTEGGAYGLGAIYAFDPSGVGSISLLASFDGSNGANPYAELTAVGDGRFYGTTRGGGANGQGTIFEFQSGMGNTAATPGPLPLFGVGAALLWSRRVRRRSMRVG